MSLEHSPTRDHSSSKIGDDLITGAPAIAAELGWSDSKTYHSLQDGKIPCFKLGTTWYARRSSLRRHFDELEEAST